MCVQSSAAKPPAGSHRGRWEPAAVRLQDGLTETLTPGLGQGAKKRRLGGQLRGVFSRKRTTPDRDMEKQKSVVVHRAFQIHPCHPADVFNINI